MPNTSIFAADKSFDIGCRVVKWDEPDVGKSFYPEKKFTPRNCSFDELKPQINSLTFHHSATYTAKQTFNGLIGRGLSVNFSIDDDCDENGYATIWQFLDIKDSGYSQGAALNHCSVGCEISYQPIPLGAYSEEHVKANQVQNHDWIVDNIHFTDRHVYAPSPAQIKSCIQLAWGICELFDLPAVFPRDSQRQIAKSVIHTPEQHKGLLCHYNITNEKWDPAGLDHALIESEVQKRLQFGF